MGDQHKTIVVTGDDLIEWRFAKSQVVEGTARYDPYNRMEVYRKPIGAVSVGDIIRKTIAGMPLVMPVRPQVLTPNTDQIMDEANLSSYWHSYVVCERVAKQKKKTDGASDRVWRVTKKLGINDTRGKSLVNSVEGDDGNADLVIIENSGQVFYGYPQAWPESLRKPRDNAWVLIEWVKPDFNKDSNFWTTIVSRFYGRIAVVIRVDDLRLSGLRISQALSWEQTVEDLCELVNTYWSKSLNGCAHLIVSFATSGVVLFSPEKDSFKTTLIYDPEYAEGVWAGQYGGSMSGLTRCITAGAALDLIRASDPKNIDGWGIKAGVVAARHLLVEGFQPVGKIHDGGQSELPKDLRFPTDGIAQVMRSVLAQHNDDESGVGKDDQRKSSLHRAGKEASELRRAVEHKTTAGSLSDPFELAIDELGLLNVNGLDIGLIDREVSAVRDSRRRYLDKSEDKELLATDTFESLMTLLKPNCDAVENAKAIVIQTVPFSADSKGELRIIDQVLPDGNDQEEKDIIESACDFVVSGASSCNFKLPRAVFGELCVRDRSEIESLRAVYQLITKYVCEPSIATPLSIAVFGQPGSGKSFAVKQIATQVGNEVSHNMPSTTFNLSQFGDAEAIAIALYKVRDHSLSGETPLVFWDEFDSDYNGKLGWLKYFLAPMQDGKFLDRFIEHDVGRAIFVFAGGTFATMNQLLISVKKNQGHGDFKPRAITQKVPDFLSRLRGYIDIPSLDYGKRYDVMQIDAAIAFRRAEILRYQLKKSAPNLVQFVPDKDENTPKLKERLNVDRGIIEAFLRIPAFLHGSRSIEAIIKMSFLTGKNMYDRSSLPPARLLDLNVDSAAFIDLVIRYGSGDGRSS
jgi:hypothetical protein